MDHLLLHCTVARELWTTVFSLFGVYWAMPKSVMELLASWKGNFKRCSNTEIWGTISNCLVGHLAGEECSDI